MELKKVGITLGKLRFLDFPAEHSYSFVYFEINKTMQVITIFKFKTKILLFIENSISC